ncbi:uridine kinase family protein [Actinomadura hibisca]|uniref:uridine kinase family protein n=1 Tax=Actinomadura hibisca TaxID=68565 RepID=UPI0009FFE36F|nr:AAA family ATPase [Actinomadura hibisca]
MPSVAYLTLTHPALADHVRGLPPSCGPVRVVAVDGPSAAGKSTFAPRLAAALGDAPLVRSDDFRVPWDADPLTWWEPLRAAVLDPLAAGRPGRLRRYDWRADAYGPPEEIPMAPAPAPVLVLEGVGAAWRGSPAAYRIWVDAPRAVRRARALARDGADWAGAWDGWADREARHFAADRTAERADLVVDGTTAEADGFRARIPHADEAGRLL